MLLLAVELHGGDALQDPVVGQVDVPLLEGSTMVGQVAATRGTMPTPWVPSALAPQMQGLARDQEGVMVTEGQT